jgi:hypothetical protein
MNSAMAAGALLEWTGMPADMAALVANYLGGEPGFRQPNQSTSSRASGRDAAPTFVPVRPVVDICGWRSEVNSRVEESPSASLSDAYRLGVDAQINTVLQSAGVHLSFHDALTLDVTVASVLQLVRHGDAVGAANTMQGQNGAGLWGQDDGGGKRANKGRVGGAGAAGEGGGGYVTPGKVNLTPDKEKGVSWEADVSASPSASPPHIPPVPPSSPSPATTPDAGLSFFQLFLPDAAGVNAYLSGRVASAQLSGLFAEGKMALRPPHMAHSNNQGSHGSQGSQVSCGHGEMGAGAGGGGGGGGGGGEGLGGAGVGGVGG